MKYDPCLPQLSKILKNNWRVMINQDKEIVEVFPSTTIGVLQGAKEHQGHLV